MRGSVLHRHARVAVALGVLAVLVAAPQLLLALPQQPIRRSPIDEGCRVFVVGASRGIGFEFAQQLLGRGCEVIASHRPDAPGRLKGLKDPVDSSERLRLLPLDVTNESSIVEALRSLASTCGGKQPHITHVIYSAGAIDYESWELRKASKDSMMRVLEVNTVGPVLLAKHVVPLLAPHGAVGRKRPPVLAFLSSRLGSIEDNDSGGGYAYRASKAGLNAVARSLAVDLAGRVAVAVLHPGYVRTDMTMWQGPLGAQESVEGMLRIIEAIDWNTGFRWVDYKADAIAW